MWPFVNPTEKLLVKNVPLHELRIGDIILYRTGAGLICHRLIKKRLNKAEGFILYTRPDASFFRGELINQDMFVGRVSAIVRNGKVINMDSRRQRFINQLIVIFSPFFALGRRIIKLVVSKR